MNEFRLLWSLLTLRYRVVTPQLHPSPVTPCSDGASRGKGPLPMSKKLRPVLVGTLGAASVAALVITTPALSSAAPAPVAGVSVLATGDLSAPAKKEIAMKLVSSAENSSL